MAVARKAFYASISPPQDYGLMTGSKKIEEQAYLSIVIPVYGCVDALSQLCSQLAEHLATITESYEVILVNDASPDDSWGQIQGLAKGDSRIKGVDLSRNFGQHAAITAGLAESAGTWVVVMDCDLQDQPKEIAKLYAKAEQGYEVVFGRRYQRQDKPIKVALSRVYRRVYDYLTDSSSDPAVANFGIYNRNVIDAFLGSVANGEAAQHFPDGSILQAQLPCECVKLFK